MLGRSFLAGLVLIGATAAYADEHDAHEPPLAAQPIDQVLYKGVAGNLLDAVPMDREERVNLQRMNAIISSPLSARSLAVLLGVANPVLLVGGIVWGIWSAANIRPAKPDTTWLVSDEPLGIGFCTRPTTASCDLQLDLERREAITEQTAFAVTR